MAQAAKETTSQSFFMLHFNERARKRTGIVVGPTRVWMNPSPAAARTRRAPGSTLKGRAQGRLGPLLDLRQDALRPFPAGFSVASSGRPAG